MLGVQVAIQTAHAAVRRPRLAIDAADGLGSVLALPVIVHASPVVHEVAAGNLAANKTAYVFGVVRKDVVLHAFRCRFGPEYSSAYPTEEARLAIVLHGNATRKGQT